VAHTSALTEADRHAIRVLLDQAFHGDVTDADYEHALGGMHALVDDGESLIAHGSVVMRRLVHAGRAWRTGYVEAVAVRPDRQRRGLGSAVMSAVEAIIRSAYDVGALGSSDAGKPFYESRGWLPWAGTASVMGPEGPRRTPEEEGWIYVLPVVAPLDPTGDLACDWRDGDVW
jgi:aminoglycoside 2'-N-acetyltransferase I